MALDVPTPGADAGTWGSKLNNVLNGIGPGTLAGIFAPRRSTYDITRYGAQRGTYLASVSMTAGSAQLSASGYSFTTGDVGKVVGVRGAGVVSTDYNTVANDGVLASTISSVSGGVATLAQSATTSCSGVSCVFGIPIDAALNSAVADATTAGGGTIYVPDGVWVARNTLLFGNRISFGGAGRGNTFFYVTKVGTAADVDTTPWLRSSGIPASGRFDELNLFDFTVDGSFYAATDAWNSMLKMIYVAYTNNSTIERIASINNPATAIGYDESTNCLIANNVIINGGRLATPGGAQGSAAGSAIGVAVGGLSDLSMNIRDNYIKGLWTTTGGTGRSGINIEAAAATTIPTTYQGGIHVTNNFIEGVFNGIVDSGGVGTEMIGNTIRRCNTGIRAGTNGHPNGSAGRDNLIMGNTIENSITSVVGGTTYTAIGITATSSAANKDTRGRTSILGNTVRGSAGYGIRIVGGTGGTPLPLEHVRVGFNKVHDSGLYGISVAGTVVNELYITNNTVTGSGQSGASGNALIVASGTVVTGGRIENNDFSDLAASPTQSNSVTTTGATLTNVRVTGNTGDPAPASGSTALFSRKNSTTTITNSTSLVTASSFSVTMEANTTYALDAVIDYTTTVAAGAKFFWTIPSGTALQWSISAPGAPTSLGAANSLTVGGVDGATSIAGRVRGLVTVGATAGTLTLQAAQATATADSMTVTTKTNMELRKVA